MQAAAIGGLVVLFTVIIVVFYQFQFHDASSSPPQPTVIEQHEELEILASSASARLQNGSTIASIKNIKERKRPTNGTISTSKRWRNSTAPTKPAGSKKLAGVSAKISTNLISLFQFPWFLFAQGDRSIDKAKNCSINPAAVLEETGKHIRECPFEDTNVKGLRTMPKHAFLINLATKTKDFDERKDFLRTFGVHLQRWPAVNGSAVFDMSEYSSTFDKQSNKTIRVWNDTSRHVVRREGYSEGFLTVGERGYMMSMKRLFEYALNHKDIQSMMVFDEDVLFDCHFKESLLEVLQSPRCGGHVAASASASSSGNKRGNGGVLVLGASIWVEKWNHANLKGWALTNHDLVQTRGQFKEEPRCFNSHSKVFGSYAVLYHRHTFQHIVNWINTHSDPFDHIYPHLTNQGFIVRVAYPFVAIQNVGHESTIDNRGTKQADLAARARLHHWQLHRYCLPDFSPAIAKIIH